MKPSDLCIPGAGQRGRRHPGRRALRLHLHRWMWPHIPSFERLSDSRAQASGQAGTAVRHLSLCFPGLLINLVLYAFGRCSVVNIQYSPFFQTYIQPDTRISDPCLLPSRSGTVAARGSWSLTPNIPSTASRADGEIPSPPLRLN